MIPIPKGIALGGEPTPFRTLPPEEMSQSPQCAGSKRQDSSNGISRILTGNPPCARGEPGWPFGTPQFLFEILRGGRQIVEAQDAGRPLAADRVRHVGRIAVKAPAERGLDEDNTVFLPQNPLVGKHSTHAPLSPRCHHHRRRARREVRQRACLTKITRRREVLFELKRLNSIGGKLPPETDAYTSN